MMEQIYKLILVDDHCLFRDTLKLILAREKCLNVIAEASNGNEFLEILDDYDPDLVLMDISMPVLDGIVTTREALKKKPGLKIIALSMYHDEMNYYRMVEAGAQGYVLKESGSEELLDAIFRVLNGESYFSNKILCRIIREFLHEGDIHKQKNQKIVMPSKRENDVLELICIGCSNNEIAKRLGISRRTVEGHRLSLLNKIGVKNSAHLVQYVMKNNILKDR